MRECNEEPCAAGTLIRITHNTHTKSKSICHGIHLHPPQLPFHPRPCHNCNFKWLCHCLICLIAVDGGWGEWSDWLTKCSKTCGRGIHSRFRQCDSPPPSAGGADCPGNPTESGDCNTDPCESLNLLNYIKVYI